MAARLIAEIGADTSGFEAGLRRADTAASRMGRQIAGRLNSAFGIGALTTGAIAAVRKLAEQVEEISEGAKKLKVTTDEYQMLSAAAKDAGQGVDEFVRSNAKQGVMLDTLIGKMGSYREQIKLTTKTISDVQELANVGKGIASGAGGFLGKAGTFAGKVALSALDFGIAMDQSIARAIGFQAGPVAKLFGLDKLLGGEPGDRLQAIGARWGLSERDSGGKALPLSGHGQQKKYDALTEKLKILEGEEIALRGAGSTRSSLWNPALTDWQQGGAYVRRGGLVITETRETINKLEEVRKEVQAVKEEQRKLREGS